MRTHETDRIGAKTLEAWIACGDTVVIDVREPAEFAREHIIGARLMPLSSLDATQLPRDKRIVLCCASGSRAQAAARRLRLPSLVRLEGGLFAWKAYGLPTIKAQREKMRPSRLFAASAQAA
jgi:rhodanese-related sulfurtransferase